MRIEFNYALEQYYEANSAHTIAVAGPPPFFNPIGFSTMVVVAAPLVIGEFTLSVRPLPLGLLIIVPAAVVPIMAVVTYLTLLRRACRGQPRMPRNLHLRALPSVRRLPRGTAGWLLALIFVAIFAVGETVAPTHPPLPSAGYRLSPLILFAPSLIWIGAMLIIGPVGTMLKDANIRKAWDAQPALHRAWSAEFTAEEAMFANPLATDRYRWKAILAYTETPNLYLLYVSGAHFHMVPKTAFADAEQLTAFGHMVRNLVSGGENDHALTDLDIVRRSMRVRKAQ